MDKTKTSTLAIHAVDGLKSALTAGGIAIALHSGPSSLPAKATIIAAGVGAALGRLYGSKLEKMLARVFRWKCRNFYAPSRINRN